MSLFNFLNVKVKNRIDTLENWNQINPVLMDGEIAIVKFDKHTKIKVGNNVDKFTDLKFIDENYINTEYISIGSNNTIVPYGFAVGLNCDVAGNFSTVLGYKSKTDSGDIFSFVWNGDQSLVEYYSAKGQGTFSINPVGGLSGFYIGNVNLQQKLNEYLHNTGGNVNGDVNINGNLSVSGKVEFEDNKLFVGGVSLEDKLKHTYGYTLTVYHPTENISDIVNINVTHMDGTKKTYCVEMWDVCSTFYISNVSKISISEPQTQDNTYEFKLKNNCTLEEIAIVNYDVEYDVTENSILKIGVDVEVESEIEETTFDATQSLALYNSDGSKIATFDLNGDLTDPSTIKSFYFSRTDAESDDIITAPYDFGLSEGGGDVDMTGMCQGDDDPILGDFNLDADTLSLIERTTKSGSTKLPNTYVTDDQWQSGNFDMYNGNAITNKTHTATVKWNVICEPDLMLQISSGKKKLYMRGATHITNIEPTTYESIKTTDQIQLIGEMTCTNITTGVVTVLYLDSILDTKEEE